MIPSSRHGFPRVMGPVFHHSTSCMMLPSRGLTSGEIAFLYGLDPDCLISGMEELLSESDFDDMDLIILGMLDEDEDDGDIDEIDDEDDDDDDLYDEYDDDDDEDDDDF